MFIKELLSQPSAMSRPRAPSVEELFNFPLKFNLKIREPVSLVATAPATVYLFLSLHRSVLELRERLQDAQC